MPDGLSHAVALTVAGLLGKGMFNVIVALVPVYQVMCGQVLAIKK